MASHCCPCRKPDSRTSLLLGVACWRKLFSPVLRFIFRKSCFFFRVFLFAPFARNFSVLFKGEESKLGNENKVRDTERTGGKRARTSCRAEFARILRRKTCHFQGGRLVAIAVYLPAVEEEALRKPTRSNVGKQKIGNAPALLRFPL